ncbi:MAG: LLM class flavin-dependent oxidoreductase [Mycobacteriales bacterium]
MRLAFSVSGRRSAGAAVRLAVEAEQAGYDEIWVTEDYCERGAFAVAGAMAGATSTMRIGIGVVNPFTRHPALVAMETAALAELAPGRVVLGLGASNRRWMQDQLGIPFERPVGRLAEALAVVRDLLACQAVDHDGVSFTVHTRLSSPVAQPPPIVLGVKGPRAIRLAADEADGLLLSVLSSAPYVRRVRSTVGSGLTLSGYVSFAFDPRREVARDRVRDTVATFLGVHGDAEITRSAGLPAELSETFRAGWLAGSPRLDLVTDHLLDTFAVAGDREDCARGLAALAAAGLDVAVIRDDDGPDPAAILKHARAAWGR